MVDLTKLDMGSKGILTISMEGRRGHSSIEPMNYNWIGHATVSHKGATGRIAVVDRVTRAATA
jgi:hypothetical protein